MLPLHIHDSTKDYRTLSEHSARISFPTTAWQTAADLDTVDNTLWTSGAIPFAKTYSRIPSPKRASCPTRKELTGGPRHL